MPKNLVFSNYVSARSLREGLASLNEKLLAVDSPGFMVPPAESAPAPGDRLFFTDEWALGQYLQRNEFEFYPRALAVELDDKLRFSQRIEALGASPVPFWPVDAELPAGEFPVLLKCRNSWVAGSPMPRGAICSSPEQLVSRLRDFENKGFERSRFFLQRLLPDGVGNSWSVAGFHSHTEPDKNELLVTHKRVATGSGLGYVLATIEESDPAGLVDRTTQLLRDLSYTGPFELEYLEDAASKQFYELEFNPRFWLQHSIFIHSRDNRLLKRYLGLPVPEAQAGWQPVLWVSGVGLALSLLLPWRQSSRKLFRLLRDHRADRQLLLDPPLPVSLRVLASEAVRRLQNR